MSPEARMIMICFLLDEVQIWDEICAIDVGTDEWRICEQLVKEGLLFSKGETTSGYAYRTNI